MSLWAEERKESVLLIAESDSYSNEMRVWRPLRVPPCRHMFTGARLSMRV